MHFDDELRRGRGYVFGPSVRFLFCDIVVIIRIIFHLCERDLISEICSSRSVYSQSNTADSLVLLL